MKIVFHGSNASTFVPGFADLLEAPHDVVVLEDTLGAGPDAQTFAAADVIVGVKLTSDLPRISARLYQVPGAGTDGIDRAALPSGCRLCNCFGHEVAIAEYVMAALLARHVPLADADQRLRQGDWRYWAGYPGALRTELGSQTIGIVGWGHIGKAVADRARAFGMTVMVANRSPAAGPGVARTFGLDAIGEMASLVDVLVVTLPLTETTRSLVGSAVLASMRPDAVVVNVGRGPAIDEDALYDALSTGRIGGAVIDTWYVYPTPGNHNPKPGNKPFHLLPNVVLTPHMSGWTEGTVARRRAVIAENVNRLADGRPLLNTLD